MVLPGAAGSGLNVVFMLYDFVLRTVSQDMVTAGQVEASQRVVTLLTCE